MYLNEIKDYWNLRAEGYSQKNIDELHSHVSQVWSERMSRFIDKENADCLDIGCGPGFLGILLAKMGHNVTLSDYSDKMLDQADINAQNAGVIVKIEKSDAQKPNFDDESFDYIVSRNLVWNLENPEQAYEHWLRMLKPGGKLLIFDGNHYLYQFNQKYMEERKCPHFKDPHTQEYMRGVDVSIINSIAYHLPLSHIERPKWDVEFFLKKRVKSIHAEPVWNDFMGADGSKKSVIKAFTICVEK